jgi:hypothetical protein
MIILKTVTNWSNAVIETLALIIYLTFLLELLLGKTLIEFVGSSNISEQLIFITNQLASSNGSTAIVFLYVIYKIYSK